MRTTAAHTSLPNISAKALHLLAMAFMLLDHLWATLIPGHAWMTCVGRLAFPIFAFLIVEGYFHTRSLKHYMLRIFAAALLSEIPFNLMYAAQPIYPFHQNVLWTFLIALTDIWLAEQIRRCWKWQLALPLSLLTTAVMAAVAGIAMTDYSFAGVWMVFIFYLFRGRAWWCMLGQLLGMFYLNVHLMGGVSYPITIFKMQFEVVQQGFALLALLPIWLYRGRQGAHSRAFQYFCYAFYPAHMLILYLLGTFAP